MFNWKNQNKKEKASWLSKQKLNQEHSVVNGANIIENNSGKNKHDVSKT